ncbi:MAG: PcfJ domain-containing protein [Sandaracinaceae bacterium]|nr:PcfJ domain-containing protein [Sandaracinaceae bacterium]
MSTSTPRASGQRALPLSVRLPRLEETVSHVCARRRPADATLTSVIAESGVRLTLRCALCRTWVDWDFRLWNLPRDLERATEVATKEVVRAEHVSEEEIGPHLASAFGRALAACDGVALEASRGFATEVRATVYWVLRHDASGRALQLAEQQPGTMIMVANAAPFEPETALDENPLPRFPIWRDVLAGRSLDHLFAQVAERLDHPELHRPRLRWLMRRAPRAARPRELVKVSRLAAVPPSDRPADPRELLVWLSVLADLDPYQSHDPRWVRYVSARYREIAHVDPVRLERVHRYVRAQDRSPSRRLPFARLAAQAEQHHERWALEEDALRVLRRLERQDTRVPEPPLPDMDEDGVRVTAVRTVRGLHEEGERMEHCIFSYWPELTAGEVAVYHVEVGAEASTVMVARVGAEWHVVEHQAPGNEEPGRASQMAVRQWMARTGKES